MLWQKSLRGKLNRSITKNSRADVARDFALHLQGDMAAITHSLDEVIGRSGTLAHTRQSLRGIQDQLNLLIGKLDFAKQDETTLTAKEHEVLQLLATSQTAREISATLVLSLATVKTHIGAIYKKFGVSNRSAAVNEARRLGLLRG